MSTMKMQDALDACYEEHREEYEYWVTDELGSTPLWECRDIGMGDFQRRSCVVFEAIWRPWETGNCDSWSPGWRKVTREEAFKMFPTAFPGMMLKALRDAEASKKKLKDIITQKDKEIASLKNTGADEGFAGIYG